VVRVWSYRREFTIRSPRLVATAVFVAVGGLVLTVAWRLDRDARRFSTESVEAALVAARVVPASGMTSTVYEVTYQPGSGAGLGSPRTEAVPVSIWESASRSGRVPTKRLDDGEFQVWRPASGTTIGVFAGVGLSLLLFGVGIATAGPRIERAVSGVSFWTLFGSIWLTVGAPFFMLALFFTWQDWRLSTVGSTVQGTVLTKDVTRSGSTPSGPTLRHSVRYRFEAANGRALEGMSEVSEAVWADLVERQPVPIEYLPGSSTHRVAGAHRRWTMAIFGGVGVLIGGAGALIVRADRRQRRRVRRLQQSGVRALARVTSVEAGSSDPARSSRR
jgi:hypothetical protein